MKTNFLSFFIMILAVFIMPLSLFADSGTASFTVSGQDDGPTTLTVTPADLAAIHGATPIDSIRLTNASGSLSNGYCGNWYAFDLKIDGATVLPNGCGSDYNGYVIPNAFTSFDIVSNDLDAYSDFVTITIDVIVYFTPSCPAPTNVVISDLSPASVQLNWTSGGSSNFNVEYGVQGFTQGTGTMLNVATDTFVIVNNLTPETAYDWYVQDSCAVGDVSLWVGPNSFTTPPTCPAPTNQIVIDITTNGAKLNWTTGGSSNFNVEYGVQGFTKGTGTVLNIVTDTFVVLSNLTSGTNYDWYVQDSCGVGDASVWLGPNTFKTDYEAITTFPWNDGFESNNTDQSAVNGWYQQSISGSYGWTANSSLTSYNRTPRTGAFNAYLKYGNTDWMYIKVSLTSGTNYRLSFWARQDASSGCTIMAGYGINSIDTAMLDTLIAPIAVSNGDYANYNTVFSPATSGIYYIGIKAALTYSPWYASIDDISITEVPLNDVKVNQIISSYDAYNMTAADTIIVEVSNNGLNDQTNIPIKYMLDNGVVISDTIPTLNALSTDTFTFASTFDATVGGSHVLTAYTDLSNDENNANDTAYKSFITAAQNDLGVITLISPVSSICGSATSSVKVIVKNYGILTQTNAPVSVIVTDSNGTPVTLTGTTASIASLATDTVDMGTVSTVLSGVYTVSAYSSLSTDTIFNDNDTLNTTFEISEIFTVSHVEDFEDGAVNWAGIGMYVGTGHGRSGKGMYKNFYSYSNTGSAMMKNKISSITATSSFVFDYQIKNWSGGTATVLADDKFYFMLSTDCGTTFDTIATIDSTTHTSTTDWTHKMIDLTSYVGQEVIIMFSGTWDAGDYYFNMDNVGIANPPAAIDLGNDTTICFNSSYVLDATSGAGSYYMWTANSDTLAFTGAILNVDTAATYAVEVMAPAGTVYGSVVITTHAVTMVSFTSLDTVYCSTVDPITLVATPTGGVFTGNGVTGDSFDPATSGLGEQIITYEFTDANTCVSTTFDTTFINEGPMVVMTADMDICEGDSVTLFAAPIVATPGVFFSMYIEGSGNNKALEVYNGTSATINLDEYSIMTNYNGNPWSGQYHFPAGATLDAGDVFVISNVAADDAMLAVADDSLAYNEGGYVVGFNGDDVRALFHNTTATDSVMVDIIGLYDLTDPGSGWDVAGVASATKDHSLIRKPSVVGGSTDWNSIAGTDSMNSQYLVYPKNTFAGLGSHTVTPSTPNMDTYLWSTGETTSSIVVMPTATTTYTVTVANTLCSDEGTVIVTVNAMPVVDLGPDQTVKHIMGSVNLDAGNVGATYLWSTGETSQIVTFNNSNLVIGDTTIFVTVDNSGCVASDTIILTVIDDVSINDMLNNVNVSIYPNPNNGQFNMTIEGITGEFNMQIVSINGKVVYNERMNSVSAQNTSIDVSELAAGVYYIKLMNNNGVKTEKLIIK